MKSRSRQRCNQGCNQAGGQRCNQGCHQAACREAIRHKGTLPIKGGYDPGQMPLKPNSPSLCLVYSQTA